MINTVNILSAADMPTTGRPLSCLLNHKCLIGGESAWDTTVPPRLKKSAEALFLEFESLVKSVGIERILFVTLTFADPLPNRKQREAYYFKLRKHLLEKRFSYGITAFDRSESGRPHFHIIVVGGEGATYRGNFDFDAWDASRSAEKKWRQSGHTDQNPERRWRELTAAYLASATPDLAAAWGLFNEEAKRFGFGRVDVKPIQDHTRCGRYFAGIVTKGFRANHLEDQGIRRVRYWGKFPRRVTPKFTRWTLAATRWRGKLAFCAHVLGFTEFADFGKYFGHRWFIYLKGIIRTVPNPVAEASLLTPNLPLGLIHKYDRKIKRIEVELHDRLDRYGRSTPPTSICYDLSR